MTGDPATLPRKAIGECRCGHRTAAHDAVALRYCTATKTGHLSRGCICRSAPLDR